MQLRRDALELGVLGRGPQLAGQDAPAVGFHFQYGAKILVVGQKSNVCDRATWLPLSSGSSNCSLNSGMWK